MQARQNPKSIRVVIADDHPLLREGLGILLRSEPDIEVVAEVERADDLPTVLEITPCDILLLDLKMDRSVLSDIQSLTRTTRVVVLTASDQLEDLVAAFRMGALGVVRKTAQVDDVLQAIRAVAGGLIWIPSALHHYLTAGPAPAERLTRRECEVVKHVAIGLRNAEVAEKLSISEGTVKVHLNNIFQKVGVRDRVELTLYALRTRLITPAKGSS